MSPFDNLAKILVQEQSKGCTNGLVIGGLEAFVETWARKSSGSDNPAHNELISQLLGSLQGYDRSDAQARRVMIARSLELIKPAVSPSRPAHGRGERKTAAPVAAA